MYILDTDHLSLIQRNGEDGKRILARLASIANAEVAVTVITYEEQVKGRLSVLARAKTIDEQVFAYRGFNKLQLITSRSQFFLSVMQPLLSINAYVKPILDWEIWI